MPLKKRPSHKGPIIPVKTGPVGRSAPSPYGDGSGTVPGPPEWYHQGNTKLPSSDPEAWLCEPDASSFWTPVKKAQIRSSLLRINCPDHISPTRIWGHMPRHDQEWKEEHKSLAI